MMTERTPLYAEIFEHKTVQVTQQGTVTYTLVSASTRNGHNNGLLAPDDGQTFHSLQSVKVSDGADQGGKLLSRDDLLQGYRHGAWRHLRLALLVLFWISVAGLVAACIYILASQRTCALDEAPYSHSWWKDTVMYQLNVKTFQDSDNDGIGDLQGLKSRLNYIKGTLGIQVIIVNPILQGLNGNNFAISDFYRLDPLLGTMTDWKDLLDELHAQNMSLIMDMPISSSSQQHPWFQSSMASQLSGLQPSAEVGTLTSDFYVWHDGYWDVTASHDGRDVPTWPNQLKTKDNGQPLWSWMPSRQQYFSHYLSSNGEAQADLNYQSENLRAAMDNVLRFWLRQGVDGFRFLNIHNMLSSTGSPLINNIAQPSLTNIPTVIVSLLNRWRRLLDESSTGKRKVLMVDGQGLDALDGLSAVDMVLNKKLMHYNSTTHSPGLQIARSIQQSLNKVDGRTTLFPNWAVGNYDEHRMASRIGSLELVDGLNMLHLLLPGSAVVYYGDELGMLDATHGLHLSPSDARFLSRGPQVSPMLWTNQAFAGFTNASYPPWLPINERYRLLNVQHQLKAPHSTLKVFQKLVHLRTAQASLRSGTFQQVMAGQSVYAFVRKSRLNMAHGFLVILDLRKPGGQPEGTDSLREYSLTSSGLNGWGTIILHSVSFQRRFKQADYNQTVDLRATISLRPSEALLIQFPV